MKDLFKQYLANRVGEKSTWMGLGVAGVLILKLFFPGYDLIIDAIAGALGVATAATPDKPKQ